MGVYIITMIGNIIIESVYAICVTVAAIHFDKPAILLWYLLLLCMGYSVKPKLQERRDGE